MIFYVNKLPEGGEMIAAAPALSAWFKTAGARKGFADAAPPPMPGR
jgi:glutathione S-transferase